MAFSVSATGDSDWNENVLTVIPQTGFDDLVLVCIHKDGDDPVMDGKTVRMTASDFITLARGLGIIVGQKLPPKSEPPA